MLYALGVRVVRFFPLRHLGDAHHVRAHTHDALRAIGATVLDGEVKIKDLRAAVTPTQQQVWWWRTQTPRWTRVTGLQESGGGRLIGRDVLGDGRVPAYMTGCHLDLLCGCHHPLQQEEAVMCLHGTSTFSFFAPGEEEWKHVKLEAGEAFVACRLWFSKFWHFASASEETIRMIVRNGSD